MITMEGKYRDGLGIPRNCTQGRHTQLARPTRPGPCLDFGFQYALIRNNRSKKFGVEYWALPGSNSPWSPCTI